MDNTNYADWTWETVLGETLNVALPDRTAVTGQPWLVIRHGADPLPGAHEFWNASWTASTTRAPGAISVYLNPALNDPAGPAALFQGAPEVLAGVPDGVYSTPGYGLLPIRPPAFAPVGQALTDAANWFALAAQQFNQVRQSAQASLSGAAAQMFADLFERLGTVATSLHDQMSEPVSYASTVVDTAGGAASSFLASLWSAYSGWTQQPAYTPAGAIIAVLQAVGQLQPDGTYVINDPANTTYGDLTSDQGWAKVEQQSKNRWLSLLTTGTGGFGGLDPLAHTALSSLISQYDSAVSVLQPVTGAAPPASRSPVAAAPVGGPDNPVPVGTGPGARPPGALPPAPGPADLVLAPVGLGPVPGAQPPGAPPPALAPAGLVLAPAPAPGPSPSAPPGGGPGDPPAFLGPAVTTANASVAQNVLNPPSAGGSGFNPPAGTPASPAIGGLGVITPVAAVPAVPAGAPGPAGPALVLADLQSAAGAAVLSGVIGAANNDASGVLGDQATPPASPGGPLADGVILPVALGPVAIGKASDASEESDESATSGTAAPDPNQAAAPARLAPVAGATLGRGVNGSALPQAQVPALSARPPSIRSSAINTQLTATVTSPPAPPAATLNVGSVGAVGAPGSLSGPAGGLVHAPAGTPGGPPAANQDATGHDIVTTFMVDQNGEPAVGVNGPMMMPQAMMGAGAGGAGGRPFGRQSFRPEDQESWGTDPLEPEAALGAPGERRQYQPAEEEAEDVEIHNRFGAIGRRSQPS